MASKLLFIRGALKAPPATQDAFQMLPHVGLIEVKSKSILREEFALRSCLFLRAGFCHAGGRDEPVDATRRGDAWGRDTRDGHI